MVMNQIMFLLHKCRSIMNKSNFEIDDLLLKIKEQCNLKYSLYSVVQTYPLVNLTLSYCKSFPPNKVFFLQFIFSFPYRSFLLVSVLVSQLFSSVIFTRSYHFRFGGLQFTYSTIHTFVLRLISSVPLCSLRDT